MKLTIRDANNGFFVYSGDLYAVDVSEICTYVAEDLHSLMTLIKALIEENLAARKAGGSKTIVVG